MCICVHFEHVHNAREYIHTLYYVRVYIRTHMEIKRLQYLFGLVPVVVSMLHLLHGLIFQHDDRFLTQPYTWYEYSTGLNKSLYYFGGSSL